MVSDVEKKIFEVTSAFERCESFSEKNRLILSYGISNSSCDFISDKNKLQACAAQSWFQVHFIEQKSVVQGYSEARLMSGLLGVIAYVSSGLSAQALSQIDWNFLRDLGLGRVITANRRAGMLEVFERLHASCDIVEKPADNKVLK